MAGLPPTIRDRYNHQLPGVYGQFGTGAGVHAFYLQSALDPSQLDWVSLISDIRGSECWQVRDLFQRDVDNDRITESLLPYLRDSDKIKFFNPLTLTPLPMQENEVLTQMPRVVMSSMRDSGRDWDVLEREGYHRVRWVRGDPQYAVLEWSDTRTKLVAIDGQHRLSALKRLWKDHTSAVHKDFKTWRIPIVIVSFRVEPGRAEPPSVLEVVRSIFVYINTEAKKVNRAREILLSDESINAVCTQELVQLAHRNDLALEDARDQRRLPLLFYDWRGEESEKQRVHAPAAVKNVEEVFNWFQYYILGDDFSDEQETTLGVDPGHQLHSAFHREKLSHADSKLVRRLAQETLLPAVCHLLENFKPYRAYVEVLRELEEQYEQQRQSDLARHAFYELRFGTNLAPEANQPEVEALLSGIKVQIEQAKDRCLHPPISLDIGMRGVVCAFGSLRYSFGNPEWMEYATWFTDSLNRVYEDKWLDVRPGAKRRDCLLHVAEDHNESVVNYRLIDADAALGAYLQLLVMAYGWPLPGGWSYEGRALKEDLLERLLSRILRGFKKQVRPQLRKQHPDGGTPLTDAVNREAGKLARKQIRRFERALERVENAT